MLFRSHSSQPSVRPKTRTSIGSLGSQATAVSRDRQPRQDPGVEGPRRSASLTALQMRPRTPGSSLAPRVLALDSSFQSLTLQQSSGLLVCLYCSGGHALDQCLKFGGLSVPELKLTFLRERGICFACLNRGHMSKDCKNRLSCGTCMRAHPTVLHRMTVEEKFEEIAWSMYCDDLSNQVFV